MSDAKEAKASLRQAALAVSSGLLNNVLVVEGDNRATGLGTQNVVQMLAAFGLGAAVYLSEFCGPRVRETLKIVIELLSAIPSVVWGFIGLTVMSRLITQYTGAPVGVNVLNGGIILAHYV